MRKLVCMTGSAADRAAAELLKHQAALLEQRFSRRFLARIGKPAPAGLPAFAERAVEVGEGGLWAALWKLGEAAKTGFIVDASAVPIRQETVEICEFLEQDPYSLPSAGAVFLCDPQAVLEAEEEKERLMLSAQEAGEDPPAMRSAFAVIGHTTTAPARIVRIGDRIRYLNRSAV